MITYNNRKQVSSGVFGGDSVLVTRGVWNPCVITREQTLRRPTNTYTGNGICDLRRSRIFKPDWIAYASSTKKSKPISRTFPLFTAQRQRIDQLKSFSIIVPSTEFMFRHLWQHRSIPRQTDGWRGRTVDYLEKIHNNALGKKTLILRPLPSRGQNVCEFEGEI